MVCSKCGKTKIIVIATVIIIAVIVSAFFVFKDKTSEKSNSAKVTSGQAGANDKSAAVNIEDVHSSPEAAITGYVDALSRRDENALCEVYSEPVYQQKSGETPNTAEYYIPYMEEIDRYYGDDAKLNVKINKVEYGAPREDMFTEKYIQDVAVVDCDLIISRQGDSEESEQHLFCIKVDGKWYVDA